MKKRVMSLLLVLTMVLGMMPAAAFAAEPISLLAAGIGDEPTEISSADGLKQLAGASENSHFILTADIALPEDWSSIAAGYNDGLTLDGNGYTITLNGTPLFGNMGSYTVSNLILDGTVTSDSGDVASLATISTGTVRNCASYADVTYTGAAGGGYAPRFVAGLIAQFSSAGTVDHCLYAGTLSYGNAEAYGSLANTAFFVNADIKNCIGIGSDRVGSAEGMSAPTEIAAGTNTLIADAADFVPANYVTWLNEKRDAGSGDLEWEIRDGRLTLKRGAEAPEATAEEIAALRAAAQQSADTDKVYTADSWSDYNEALDRARTILTQEKPKQNTVVNATAALNAAYGGLTERSLAAVDLSGQEIISITSAGQLESLASGKYYRLDADIEITDSYWFGSYNSMNAVLDGNGHTITLKIPNGSCLWASLGSDAVIQNLGIKGSVSYSTHTGVLANSSQGLIVNCWSLADVTPSGNVSAGGLTGNLQSGGAIVNCYVAGNVTSKGDTGMLAGNTEGNSLIELCYAPTDNFKGAGEGIVHSCEVKSRKDFYSSEFLAQLNQNRGTWGKEWTLSAEGYPHLGLAESYTPPEAATITFTYPDQREVTFQSDEGLTVSLQDASGYYAGQFSMEGAARWQDTIVGNKDVLLVNESGTLNIYKPGSADVVAISSEEDGSRELARFTVTVVQGEAIDGFRLTLRGQDVGDSLTLQGSEQVTLIPEIQKDSVWSSISPSQVQFSHTGALHQVGGTIYAEEPGQMSLTATYMDKTVSVNITSQFVPITAITPAPSGTYVIHQRNTNAQPLGAFINLTLSDGAGTVTVAPENASYRDKWTMSSSDDTIAEYVASMLVAVLPKKAGTVTLTAVVEEDGLQPRVEGTSQITIQYKNPVETVEIEKHEFTVKENEELSLPLSFRGPKSSEGLQVTEPAMDWNFSGDGQVEIVTDGLPIVTKQLGDGTLLCEANDKYKLVGVTAGTVTVVGTPKDQTSGARPVTFTVTVESGAPLEPADNDALTAVGIANGKSYLNAIAGDYTYGDEWEIFSLRRSGQTVGQAKVDAYLNSVENTYKNNPDNTAMKPTTIARVALTLGALGENAADFRGLNFPEMLYTSTRIREGGNEVAWALIALDSRDYAVAANGLWTRDKLVTELIDSYQAADGGFGLNDNQTTGIDMTAMAIQALAPYYTARQDVREAVDKALSYLQNKMSLDCGFEGNAESTAQVVIALTMLGWNPVDRENGFARNEAVNLLTNLTGFAHADGGYKHYADDRSAQPMSTTQVLMAFEAYRRLAAGEATLYDLTDATEIRSVLVHRLAEANALQASDYTAQTWAVLLEAVAEAQRVLEDAAADEVALKAADTALAAALTGLKRAAGSGSGTSGDSQDTITVTFRLIGDTRHDSADKHDKYINWIRTMSITVPAESTVYDVFSKALAQKKMRFEENQTSYISGIRAPSVLGGYWLREFDNGRNSGWKYLVNGRYPGVGLRYYWLEDGDSVIWRYVDDYTDSEDNSSKWKEAEDVAPSSGGGGAVDKKDEIGVTMQLKPETTVNAKGEANASVTEEELSNAVSQAKADQADTIAIVPQVKGDASKVSVELPKSGVDAVAKQTDTVLKVETNIANITIPRRSLNDLAEQTGSKITVSAEADKDGDTVKIAVILDGETLEKIDGGLAVSMSAAKDSGNVLAVVKADGTEEIVKKSVVNDGRVFALLDGSVAVKIVDNTKAFTDTVNHWGKQAVDFVTSHELFAGMGETRFSPDVSMSRAMVATVLYHLEDAMASGTNPFADVAEGTWYTDAVIWASREKIVSGTKQGFQPNRDVTRQELAVMLYNYAESVGADVSRKSSLSAYSDSGEVSGWAKDAMEWAVAGGLISGRNAATLAPKSTATRAEVAVILQRLVEMMVK